MPSYNINVRTESHIADTVKVEKDDIDPLCNSRADRTFMM